jgi:hypothetical protein
VTYSDERQHLAAMLSTQMIGIVGLPVMGLQPERTAIRRRLPHAVELGFLNLPAMPFAETRGIVKPACMRNRSQRTWMCTSAQVFSLRRRLEIARDLADARITIVDDYAPLFGGAGLFSLAREIGADVVVGTVLIDSALTSHNRQRVNYEPSLSQHV